MLTTRSFLFLSASARPDGNTELLARAAAEQLPSGTEPLELTLNHTAAYMGMRFGGVLLGHGSRPGQVLEDERALLRAKTFFASEAPLARFPDDS